MGSAFSLVSRTETASDFAMLLRFGEPFRDGIVFYTFVGIRHAPYFSRSKLRLVISGTIVAWPIRQGASGICLELSASRRQFAAFMSSPPCL